MIKEFKEMFLIDHTKMEPLYSLLQGQIPIPFDR